ncbi:MAG: hypothetical protein QOJ97_583 [Solirubrobacteraceae bacterium]|nr:hypothetical protein [Solirubrobacteraceae bacterium]
MPDEPVFFAHPEEFRAWLERHHESASELLVGFHRKGTGRPSLTWAQSVDEALCFGWIDGVRRRVDAERYSIRFTPRRARSIWSAVNVARVADLTAQGRMRPAGLRAFEAREAGRTGVYSHERAQDARLAPEEEQRFQADAAAWEFFQSQPPGYRRTALHLVVSAKRPETRERRLAALIEDSGRGLRIKQLRR